MERRIKLVRAKKETKKHSVAMKMDGSRLDNNEEQKVNSKKDQRKHKTKHFATKSPAKTNELDRTMIDE